MEIGVWALFISTTLLLKPWLLIKLPQRNFQAVSGTVCRLWEGIDLMFTPCRTLPSQNWHQCHIQMSSRSGYGYRNRSTPRGRKLQDIKYSRGPYCDPRHCIGAQECAGNIKRVFAYQGPRSHTAQSHPSPPPLRMHQTCTPPRHTPLCGMSPSSPSMPTPARAHHPRQRLLLRLCPLVLP